MLFFPRPVGIPPGRQPLWVLSGSFLLLPFFLHPPRRLSKASLSSGRSPLPRGLPWAEAPRGPSKPPSQMVFPDPARPPISSLPFRPHRNAGWPPFLLRGVCVLSSISSFGGTNDTPTAVFNRRPFPPPAGSSYTPPRVAFCEMGRCVKATHQWTIKGEKPHCCPPLNDEMSEFWYCILSPPLGSLC